MKQLRDEMSADLVDARKAEVDCKVNHTALVAAKEEEIASSTGQSKRDLCNQS